ncbi:MAG: metallophosphoesterase family protein [Pyrinomonadaceae bacterium]
MKFLHISDVHLGCARYQLNESPRDFFEAWLDVLDKYAIAEMVEFVIICGDFFHKRHVDPQTMNHAFYGLQKLREAQIPVIVIEGNHDQHYNDVRHSWLRSLNDWGLIKLLEPDSDDRNNFKIWDERQKTGSFIDIGRARIFGSYWYGASANVAIPMITKSIQENRRENAFHILMLHTDVEGYATHPIPALSRANLNELKAAVEYVGLGHTHKHYEIDNWAFNPGSLEVTSIDEYSEAHGAFLVEVSEENQIAARHLKDYQQRPFQRLLFDVSGYAETKDITNGILNLIKNEAKTFDGKQPIIEITLRGHLGFPNSRLELQKIREEAQKLTDALHVRIKNFSAPVDYAIAPDAGEDISREQLERRVIQDLIVLDNRYKLRAEEIAGIVIEAKKQALNDEPPEKIVDYIALKTVNSES